jgi:hypothetical protein
MRFRAIFTLLAIVTIASQLRLAPARAQSSLPDSRLGMRTAPLLLLSRPDVRADLRMDAKQAAEAEQEISALYVKAAALKGKSGAEAVAARQQIDAEQQRWFETHLSESQYGRLIQIDLQWEGPSALISRPVLTARLKLTPTQVSGLREAVAKRNRERGPRGTYDSAADARLARSALAILSKPQQDQWKNLLGPPFQPQVASAKAAPPRR